jgi:membrane-associated phospholipid phosphatase
LLCDGRGDQVDALMPAGGALLAAVRVLWPAGLNTSYYLDLNSFSRRTAWAHGFMHDYALWLGLALLAAVFVLGYAVVWWRRDTRAAVLMLLGGAGTLVALGLNQLVGHAAQEARPYDAFPHALVLVAKTNDYAFPSDHAVVAGALLMSLLLVVRRAKPESWPSGVRTGRWTASVERPRGLTRAMLALCVVSALLGLFLCFARVYVGAHYPGDVVAGLLLGMVVVTIVSAARPLGYAVADGIERTSLAVVVRRPPASEEGLATGEQTDRPAAL